MGYKIAVGNEVGKTTFTRSGITSHQEYIADTYDEALNNIHLPGYESPYWAGMTVDTSQIVGEGACIIDEMGNAGYSWYRVIEDYSLDYRKLRPGDPPKVTMSLGGEMLTTGEGKLYVDTQRAVPPGVYNAVPSPLLKVSIDYAVYANQLPQGLVSLMGKVNQDPFPVYSYDSGSAVLLFEAPAETMLFEGSEQVAQMDYDSFKWYYRMTLNLLWRPFSHNLVYRAPAYQVDESGVTLVYQDKEPTITATYTTEATLVSLPIPLAGSAGIGGWTTTYPLNHELKDFGSLFVV